MTGSAVADRRPPARLVRTLLPTLGFAALAAFTVARSALRFANSDDFDLALGKWPPTAAWLWAQHLEHRIALPKLLLAACARHGDFRVAVWLSWALLVAAAAWLVARVDRGPVVAVLVPAVLLCPANNVWHWDVELQFAACAALAVFAFAHALTARGLADAVAVALASLLLPLTGGNGLVLSAATVLASLALAADRALPRAARAVFAAGAVATVAVDLAYLHGYAAPAQHEALHARSLGQIVAVAAHLSLAPLGSLAERAVDAAGAVAAPLVGLVALAAVAAVVAIAIAIARAPHDPRLPTARRTQRLVTGSLFAGSLAVAAAIAVARAGRGWPPGLEAHYASLVAPAYVVALVAVAPFVAALPRARRRLVVGVAAVGAVLMYLAYLPTSTRESRVRERAFVADCGTAPADVLAARHLPLFYWIDTPDARARVAAYVATLDCAALRR